eukprot:TRINITY_DN44768_c0_g1_i1.p1 TRINITY_DN44768_c0_g1~~TRINITY_DN44768_c0_g1_i1.p1  ORF type:complete len:346 (+),score=79.94 TRINITY_DN44768_c0_g1_i1:30-1067(+)
MLRNTICLRSKVSKEVRQALKLMKADVSMGRQGLKERYRDMAKVYHPDVNKGDDSKMKDLNRAYAVVETYLETVKAEKAEKPQERFGEDRKAKKKELSLVERLAAWMREGDQNQKDPMREFKEFVDKPDDEKLREVMGSDEDELRWATQFEASRDERLSRKNQWKTTSKRNLPHNPYDRHSIPATQARLENLSQQDPALYWAKPLDGAHPPEGYLPHRQNPHILIQEQKRREYFFNKKAWKMIEQERHAQRVARAKRRDQYMNYLLKAEPTGLANLEKKVELIHEGNVAAMALPESKLPVSEMGTRPPRTLRKAKALVSFKSADHSGNPVTVVMNKGRFLTRGTN